MDTRFPPQVLRFFWGDDLTQLNWSKHQKYIIQTLLEKGDFEVIKWLFKLISPAKVKELLPSLRLSSKSSHFWQLYLS
jgi:hypothetical protein